MHRGYRIDTVYICRAPVDFRKSIAGLSAMVEQCLGLNPFAASLFVFVNRDRNRLKILYWDRNGFCLWYKRLEAERFAWPRKGGRRGGAEHHGEAVGVVVGGLRCVVAETA